MQTWTTLLSFLWCIGLAITTYSQDTEDTTKSMKQVIPNSDTTSKRPDTQAGPDLSKLEPIFENVFIYDFFTTANVIDYENAVSAEQKDELNFYYNVTLNNFFKTKYFTIRSYFFNEYGIKYFFDSVTTKGPDNFQTTNALQFQLVKKYLRLQLGVTSKSQFWKTYNYRTVDSLDKEERYLYSDYFSPGYVLYSFGVSYRFLKNATVDIGIIGGRTTKIRNQAIFDERQTVSLYGLKKGEHKKESYGLHIAWNIPPRRLTKHFGWESTGSIYADKEQIGRLQGYSYQLMNVFHYMFLKNLRISLRTSLKYDERISAKTTVVNMLSVGFYLSNKI